jgi:predicted nucleotidyltransferase
MYLTTTETEILQLYINNISLELSINAIATKLHKHYRVIHENVLRLIAKKIFHSKELAGARIISLQLSSTSLARYLPYVEEIATCTRMNSLLPHTQDIINKAREISPIFILGIFGSYASQTQKKGSDIDMFIICQAADSKKYTNMINQFPAIQELIHWNVFTREEFTEGLHTKGTLIYKEIIKNKSIMSGAAFFYNSIAEVGVHDDN